MRRFLAVLLLFVPTVSCFSDSQSPKDCVCTAEFVSIRFLVVDDSGSPLPGVEVEVRVQRTGELLDISQTQASQGILAVANDSHVSKLRAGGDRITVQGSLGARSFSEVFEVNFPGECQCHIAKVAGPDTVIVGRAE